MIRLTFPHDIVKELHDGDASVRVVVEQLGINSGCEELPKKGKMVGDMLTERCTMI